MWRAYQCRAERTSTVASSRGNRSDNDCDLIGFHTVQKVIRRSGRYLENSQYWKRGKKRLRIDSLDFCTRTRWWKCGRDVPRVGYLVAVAIDRWTKEEHVELMRNGRMVIIIDFWTAITKIKFNLFYPVS